MPKPRKEDRPFSGTEVGTLIESLRNDISVIGERVGTLCEDVDVLKTDVSHLKTDMAIVKDVIGVMGADIKVLKRDVSNISNTSMPSINSRFDRLETKVGI